MCAMALGEDGAQDMCAMALGEDGAQRYVCNGSG